MTVHNPMGEPRCPYCGADFTVMPPPGYRPPGGQPYGPDSSVAQDIQRAEDRDFIAKAMPAEPVADMPSPTDEEIETIVFRTIFDTIKNWDIMVPGHGGYCSGNGSHVKMIIDAIKKAGPQ